MLLKEIADNQPGRFSFTSIKNVKVNITLALACKTSVVVETLVRAATLGLRCQSGAFIDVDFAILTGPSLAALAAGLAELICGAISAITAIINRLANE